MILGDPAKNLVNSLGRTHITGFPPLSVGRDVGGDLPISMNIN